MKKNAYAQLRYHNDVQTFVEISDINQQKSQKQPPLTTRNGNGQLRNKYHEMQYLNRHLIKQYQLTLRQ